MVATVGVLALQGGVEEHLRILDELGVATRRVRVPRDLEGLDGLVIPGGESSVIDKLARSFGLAEPLRDAAAAGLPVLATCAGLIYCARQIDNPAPGQQTLGLLDVTVRRNAFGNQRFSEERTVPVAMGEDTLDIEASFIPCAHRYPRRRGRRSHRDGAERKRRRGGRRAPRPRDGAELPPRRKRRRSRARRLARQLLGTHTKAAPQRLDERCGAAFA